MELQFDKALTRLAAPMASAHRSCRGLLRTGAHTSFSRAGRPAHTAARQRSPPAGDSQGFRPRALPGKSPPAAALAEQQSARRKASTVRAVSLHAAIVLASLVAASVTLVACGH